MREEARRFEAAARITLGDIRQWTLGETFHLISRSYYYPDDEPVFDEFEYQHHHIDEDSRTEFGWEVHGFARDAIDPKWRPRKFLASEEKCQTASCAGTLRLILMRPNQDLQPTTAARK